MQMVCLNEKINLHLSSEKFSFLQGIGILLTYWLDGCEELLISSRCSMVGSDGYSVDKINFFQLISIHDCSNCLIKMMNVN